MVSELFCWILRRSSDISDSPIHRESECSIDLTAEATYISALKGRVFRRPVIKKWYQYPEDNPEATRK